MKILSSLDFPIKHKSVKTLNFTNFTAKKLWVECTNSAKKGRTFFVRLPHDLEDNSRGALSVIKAKKMLSGENHDVRWIAAHERLKSYGCDQKAAALLPASKLEARVRVRLKHLKMLQSTKSKAHFSGILKKYSATF